MRHTDVTDCTGGRRPFSLAVLVGVALERRAPQQAALAAPRSRRALGHVTEVPARRAIRARARRGGETVRAGRVTGLLRARGGLKLHPGRRNTQGRKCEAARVVIRGVRAVYGFN